MQTSTPPQKEAQTQPREEHETKKNTNRELTSQLKEAKDGENSSSGEDMCCVSQGMRDAHTCMVCGLPTHAICGHSGATINRHCGGEGWKAMGGIPLPQGSSNTVEQMLGAGSGVLWANPLGNGPPQTTR